MKAHCEKLMNVSDMQVLGRMIVLLHSFHHTIKANSKIVKERIWMNLVTSKIIKQPLESDTDAQLHEELHPRNVPDEVPTSRNLFDETKFQEEVKVAQNTVVELQHTCHEKHR